MNDPIDIAVYYGKLALAGVGLIFAMMFIAFPLGIAIIFGWEGFVTWLQHAATRGAQ